MFWKNCYQAKNMNKYINWIRALGIKAAAVTAITPFAE